MVWCFLFVGPEVHYLQHTQTKAITHSFGMQYWNTPKIVSINNSTEAEHNFIFCMYLQLFLSKCVNLTQWNASVIGCKVTKRYHRLLTKTENRQLYLPGMEESREQWAKTIHLLVLVFKVQQQQHRFPPALWRDPHISALHRGVPSIAKMAPRELLAW